MVTIADGARRAQPSHLTGRADSGSSRRIRDGKERRIINSLKQTLATVGANSAGGEMTPQAIL